MTSSVSRELARPRTDWAASVELSVLALVVVGLALVGGRLPHRIEIGEAVLLGAAFLLVQGLVRDLFRLRDARAKAKGGGQRVTCVCAESTVGLGSIVVGALLVFAPNVLVVTLPSFAWATGAALVGTLGFAMRHLVFDWKTKSVRLERDHASIVVALR